MHDQWNANNTWYREPDHQCSRQLGSTADWKRSDQPDHRSYRWRWVDLHLADTAERNCRYRLLGYHRRRWWSCTVSLHNHWRNSADWSGFDRLHHQRLAERRWHCEPDRQCYG